MSSWGEEFLQAYGQQHWVGGGWGAWAVPGILVDLGIVIPEGIVLKSEGLFYGLSSFNWSGAATERYFDMIPIVIKITL